LVALHCFALWYLTRQLTFNLSSSPAIFPPVASSQALVAKTLQNPNENICLLAFFQLFFTTFFISF
jgi:hypothetical protein